MNLQKSLTRALVCIVPFCSVSALRLPAGTVLGTWLLLKNLLLVNTRINKSKNGEHCALVHSREQSAKEIILVENVSC